jgi:hypothetical protein
LNHNPWIFLCHSVLRFLLTFFFSAVSICGCFLVRHVFLRVTMMSSTKGKITSYLPRALIWIGNVIQVIMSVSTFKTDDMLKIYIWINRFLLINYHLIICIVEVNYSVWQNTYTNTR